MNASPSSQLDSPQPAPIDHNSLQELVRLQLQIQTRIATIRNSSENGLSYQSIQEQNAILKPLLEKLETTIADWRLKSDEIQDKTEAQWLKERVKKHAEELTHLKESLRKANVVVKMDREKQYAAERHRLLGDGGLANSEDNGSSAKRRQIRTQEDALKESKTVVEGLKRLRNMMATEVQLGQEILVELDDQGKVINSAVQELDDMAVKIRKGRGWLSLLRRREVTDKMLVTMALVFFCFVCFYIIKVRLRITFFGYWP